jgi:hypothetical protein
VGLDQLHGLVTTEAILHRSKAVGAAVTPRPPIWFDAHAALFAVLRSCLTTRRLSRSRGRSLETSAASSGQMKSNATRQPASWPNATTPGSVRQPIGKWYAGVREGPVREFMQDPPARVIPGMARQFGAPKIRCRIQQLVQPRAVVLVRSEGTVIQTEAFLHITLLQMSKSEMPAQVAAKGPVARIAVEPGTKEQDGGVGLTILVMASASRPGCARARRAGVNSSSTSSSVGSRSRRASRSATARSASGRRSRRLAPARSAPNRLYVSDQCATVSISREGEIARVVGPDDLYFG